MDSKSILTLFIVLFVFILLPFEQLDAQTIVQGNMETRETYTNPVGGDIRMGDPFVLKSNGKYYLYGTTASDGFKCWRSGNLRDWESMGYAYRRTETSWGGKTFWAPEVVFYQGKYFMIFSCQPESNRKFSIRLCLAVSDKPEGPFQDLHAPLLDNGWSCIDGHIFIDRDGTPYLFFDKVGSVGKPWNGADNGYLYGIIYGVQLKNDLSGIVGEPVRCIQADCDWELSTSEGQTPTRCNEGAFVLRHQDVYYMTYSANHYADPNYGIGYATANSPLGPWKKSEHNPIVKSDPAIGVSGPGHNSFAWSPYGNELFIIYHAHADPKKPSGNRTVNIDRVRFNKNGEMTIQGPTRSPQPLPSQ